MRYVNFLLVTFIIFFSGCKSEDALAPLDSNPLNLVPSSIPGVYVGGYEETKSGWKAKIWKNEDVNFTSPNPSEINDIFVAGKDIYAVGYESKGVIQTATIWKNGVSTNLGNGLESSNATGIFVINNDVYVCGYQTSSVKPKSPTGVVWKNGIASEIAPNLELSSIFVSGSDVFTSGTGGSTKETSGVYFYKNGQKIYFEMNGGWTTGLFVSENNVYASGYGITRPGQAKMWKNGVVTILDQLNVGSIGANDIFVFGNDVYVVGYKSLPVVPLQKLMPSLAILWKNGVASNLSDGISNSVATSLFVSGKDIFVCGYEFTTISQTTMGSRSGVIWKNGVKTVVSKSNEILYPRSIFVVK
jgi:hypothetical protein